MKCLELPGEVVSSKEGSKMIFELTVGRLVISPDGCLVQRSVHLFGLLPIFRTRG